MSFLTRTQMMCFWCIHSSPFPTKRAFLPIWSALPLPSTIRRSPVRRRKRDSSAGETSSRLLAADEILRPAPEVKRGINELGASVGLTEHGRARTADGGEAGGDLGDAPLLASESVTT